jgi:hypothetical protein
MLNRSGVEEEALRVFVSDTTTVQADRSAVARKDEAEVQAPNARARSRAGEAPALPGTRVRERETRSPTLETSVLPGKDSRLFAASQLSVVLLSPWSGPSPLALTTPSKR